MPTNGTYFYGDTVLNKLNQTEQDNFRKNIVSFVFQDYNLLTELTVYNNIKLTLNIRKTNKNNIDELVNKALKAVDILDLKDRKISTLSGGQQQRVAIARAIVNNSEIILCDEPTGNLDTKITSDIFKLLKEISKTKLVIIVTHDEKSAEEFSDRIIRLEDGIIISDLILDKDTNIKEQYNKTLNLKQIDTKTTLVSFKVFLQNLKKYWFLNVLSLTILSILIGITSTFANLYKYEANDAVVTTLKSNDEYLLQLAKYEDRVYDLGGHTYFGPQIIPERTKESDYGYLKERVQQKDLIYKSYFFNKTFQDFTTEKIDYDNVDEPFYDPSFREYIAVSDFNNFNLELISGRYTANYNEVLIYDYMAKSLEYYGLVNSFEESLNKTFTDTDTNYSFTIVGILKSKYKDYLTENNSKKGLDNFSELYLSSLQALFALPSHLESIKKDANITTISNLSLKYFDVDDKQFPLQCKKAKFYYNLDELKDYIVYQKNTDYTHYSFISLSEFKEVYKIIYNKDFDGDFNTEDAQAIFDNTMYT